MSIELQLKEENLFSELEEFLATAQAKGWPRSAWISCGTLRVYVRLSRRPGFAEVLEIANVVNDGPKGRGDFSRFLDKAQSFGLPVRVENIANQRLAAFLLQKRSFEREFSHGVGLNVIWFPEEMRLLLLPPEVEVSFDGLDVLGNSWRT